MNVFEWVDDIDGSLREAGNGRLADILEELPGQVLGGRHAAVEALVAEGLALARAAELPWAEVFIRHWGLQGKVFHEHRIAESLTEAVSLLERSSRPDARDCPQSICAVQDLSGCYGFKDGDGYAAERLALCDETLARIAPSWNCYECITSQKGAALADAGRLEEALAFLDAQRRRIDDSTEMEIVRADVQHALGRHEAALRTIREARKRADQRTYSIRLALQEARALAALGRGEEALEALPPMEIVLEQADRFATWAEAGELLAGLGVMPNDYRIESSLAELEARLGRQGCERMAFDMAERRVRLAVARGRRRSARRALASAESRATLLRHPASAEGRLATLRDLVSRLPEPQRVPPPRDEDGLPDDPEVALDALEQWRAQDPENELLATTEAGILGSLGAVGEAIAMLAPWSESHPESEQAAGVLSELLADADDAAGLAALAGRLDARGAPRHLRAHVVMMLGQVEANAGRDDRARAAWERAMEIDPEAVPPRLLLARRLVLTGRADEAVNVLGADAEDGKPGALDIELLVAGSAAGRWDLVRAASARLGVDLGEGSEPIEERMGLILVASTAGGPVEMRAAMRTGPATASIVELSAPRERQRYGDVVLIEPGARDAGEDDGDDEGGDEDAEGEALPEHAEILVISEGGYRSEFLDGAHPGDEALQQLRVRLLESGLVLRDVTSPTYVLRDPDGGGELPGLFAYVGAPLGMSDEEVSMLLREATSGWPHPPTWLDLAARLADPAELERQEEVRERYGI